MKGRPFIFTSLLVSFNVFLVFKLWSVQESNKALSGELYLMKIQMNECKQQLLASSAKGSTKSATTISSPVGECTRSCSFIHPILHQLNIKTENVYKTLLTLSFPRPNNDTIVVEVGSNDGKQAVWAGQQGYRVISFEPAPSGYRRCLKTLENAGRIQPGSVEFRNLAVSNRAGEELRFFDMGVVSRIDPKGDVKVKTTTLDIELGNTPIYLAKIDVEGHEMAVLQGMKSILETNPPQFLIMEHNPTQLKKHGFGGSAMLLQFVDQKGYDVYDLRLLEFQGKEGFSVLTSENKWSRPGGFESFEKFMLPEHPATPWGAWTDILAVRRPNVGLTGH